jgi:hypothetical protein
MRDELTDSQIALLCDIEESDLTKFAGDKKRDLDRLLSEGYVEPTNSHPGSAFKLTAKGADGVAHRDDRVAVWALCRLCGGAR